ncbi:atp-dependent rna helicase dbp6 [Acrodontium crateriforme]|uniref:ATP-dependent RNA helicase n=1 Tax=Acrodontium crateriforme TaxID=150365 RepID=A0AAQ3M7J4_9PEZI|nr:atp-dependent rna helicase dbp6 [Acrodontium crateriforme]
MSTPLYKRYVPPKPAMSLVAAPVSEAREIISQSSIPDDEKKRKREPSEKESAQRKAKKAKEKESEGSGNSADEQSASLKQTIAKDEQPTNSNLSLAAAKSKSEFAHVKNIKKRHKLEKEARKQKKAAERGLRPNGEHDAEQSLGNNESEIVEYRPVKANDGLSALNKAQQEDDGDDIAMQDVDEANIKEPEHTETQKSYDPSQSQPKKRRHKLEAAMKQPKNNDDDDEGENNHLKKHSSIIGKFQRAQQISSSLKAEPSHELAETGEQPVLHDLVPLPQPERFPTPEFVPEYSDLPPWLAQPIIVPSDSKTDFASLGLAADAIKRLADNGFTEALPVQNAVIPLLLPPGTPGAKFIAGTQDVLPDLAVSAATGSGKTIAYVLPIIEALRQRRHIGSLRSLIVVPTRELVIQVAKTAESLTKDLNIRVGTAIGTGKFKDEQEKLVRISYHYDPEGYANLMAKLHRQNYPPSSDTDEYETYLEELEQQNAKEDQRLNDALSGPVNHVPQYQSRVDILVCTPGRLLEHMSSTLGFGLTRLEWLVLDEADKLLDQQYDGFLATLHSSLEKERTIDEQDSRERFLRSRALWNEKHERRVRKVVLSATMTQDISKLVGLRLRRPKMLIVRGREADRNQGEGTINKSSGSTYELPRMLMEYCIPVGDGSEKPLTLIELLDSKILAANLLAKKPSEKTEKPETSDESMDSDSDSDISSVLSDSSSDVSSSDSSDSDSDSDSSSDSEESESSSDSEKSNTEENEATGMHPARAAFLADGSNADHRSTETPTVLIFTSSNEAAARLFHLLKALRPQWTPFLTTLTKNQSNKTRGRSSAVDRPSVTIATDRAGRGLDTIAGGRVVTHVVQYDVPRSVTSYVHRVGRTARAGRKGDAWTLYTHSEARWFLREVARTSEVRRVNEVEKVKIDVHDDSLRERYLESLAGMREEVFGKQDA